MALARNQLRVLALLASATREQAGIDVANALEDIGRSSVHAALAALQRDGLVEALWDHSGSHPRRLVQINGNGRQTLTAEHDQSQRIWDSVEAWGLA